MYTLLLGDCLDVLSGVEDCSVDSVVCDPPYGLSFMGKRWDYDVPSVAIWRECLRVLKPGGYLLAFAGSRTQHRMAVNIEDAGFEIRDMIAWVYGSGFPKSHNVSCSIDKMSGHGNRGRAIPTASSYQASDVGQENKLTSNPVGPYEPKTDDAKKWAGYGSALKPSIEIITVASKPESSDWERDIIVSNLKKLEEKLWLTLNARVVHGSLDVSLPGYKEALSFVQWNADDVLSTLASLSGLMDMSQSDKVMTLSLNIVSSWRSTLEECLGQESTSITSMELSTIIDLKTLKSLVSKITLGDIVAASLNLDGLPVTAPIAVKRLSAYVLLLQSTLMLSVTENAIDQTEDLSVKKGFSPSIEPITVARKPLDGTIAENVLKWGTGAMNIDGCRVPMDQDDFDKLSRGVDAIRERGGSMDNSWKNSSDLSGANPASPLGRWPANFIHDGSQEVLDLFPDVKGGSWINTDGARHFNNNGKKTGYIASGRSDASTGSAARFFYCSKSNKRDRNEGCESIEAKQYSHDGRDTPIENAYQRNGSKANNFHPTVKPTDLMRYLCRLVTQPGGVVLDPFMGSGTTGKAAMLEGFRFIGCEMDEEYYKIAEARVVHAYKQKDHPKD